jgi:hypothetical protein
MASLSSNNVKELMSMSVATFDVDTSTDYRVFVLTKWDGTESYYKRAGNAILRMKNGNEPYFMHGIRKDGTMVLIAAH